MSATDRKKVLKLWPRADETTRDLVRGILGGEPSGKLLESVTPGRLGQVLMLLQSFQGPAQTPPRECFEVQAYWDDRLLRYGHLIPRELLDEIRVFTRAEKIGKGENGVSPSIAESKWEIYVFLSVSLGRKSFDLTLAEFCGLSKEEVDHRVEMHSFGVKDEEELEQVKAFREFAGGLSKEDRALLKELMKAIKTAPLGHWATVMDLADNDRFRRANELAKELITRGFVEQVPIPRGRRF